VSERGVIVSARRLLAGLALGLGFGVPLLWAVLASFTPETELFARGQVLPSALTLDHYRDLFAERDFWAPIERSLIVASWTTALCLVLGGPCAWALARLRFAGKRPILALVLALGMFPQITIVSPLYLALRGLGLIDTTPGLVLPYLTFALPLTVWLLVGFFRQLPGEIVEAATVDGASRLTVMARIVLPLAMPGLATTSILTFIFCWNELLFALSFTVEPDRRTVPVAIALLRGQYQIPWGQILAASVVATSPVAVVTWLFQRRIVRGLTAGAVKG
jgi:ABC-type glycerol-3-phosphate transport system permease component